MYPYSDTLTAPSFSDKSLTLMTVYLKHRIFREQTPDLRPIYPYSKKFNCTNIRGKLPYFDD